VSDPGTYLAFLGRLAELINEHHSPVEVLRRAWDDLRAITGADGLCLGTYLEDGMRLRVDYGVEDGEVLPHLVFVLDRDAGCYAWVARNRLPLLVRSVPLDQEPHPVEVILGSSQPRSWLGVPLVSGDAPLGIVALHSRTSGGLGPGQRDLMRIVASQLLGALGAEDSGRRREAKAILEVTKALTSQLETQSILECIAREACHLLGADIGTVFEYERETEQLACAAAWGSGSEAARDLRVPLSFSPSVSEVARTRQPLAVYDATVDGRVPEELVSTFGIKSSLVLPLEVRGELVGFLILDTVRAHRDFRTDGVAVAADFAHIGALALEKSRLEQTKTRQAQILTNLQMASAAISGVLDTHELLPLITRRAAEVVDAPAASLMLWDEDERTLVIRASFGLSQEYVQGQRIPRDRLGEALRTTGCESTVITDLRVTPHGDVDLIVRERLRSALVTTLVTSGRFMGLMNLYSKGDIRDFRTGEREASELFAHQIAVAIENARLYTEAREALFDTLALLASAVEAKDMYTQGHSRRVATLARRIAERLGLTQKDVEEVALIALLHDIGKIGVREEILKKPSKLTVQEWEEAKSHVEGGSAMLESVEPLKRFSAVVRHHHERYDGGGYPDGLRGDQIPLAARIVAVADSFEAMISDRPYRKARSRRLALLEIEREAGRQFDPTVVRALLEELRRAREGDPPPA
jgi:putative nucleotidyltransferase with HDIG domain